MHKSTDEMPSWLADFCRVYQGLSADSDFAVLSEIYDLQLTFVDPMHEINGLANLVQYFDSLYQQVTYCQFDITQVFWRGDDAAVYWQMTYQHKQLNGGNKIFVEGHSHLKGHDKVFYHRDYIDLGQMLYEHIPLIGRAISWLKNRVQVR